MNSTLSKLGEATRGVLVRYAVFKLGQKHERRLYPAWEMRYQEAIVLEWVNTGELSDAAGKDAVPSWLPPEPVDDARREVLGVIDVAMGQWGVLLPHLRGLCDSVDTQRSRAEDAEKENERLLEERAVMEEQIKTLLHIIESFVALGDLSRGDNGERGDNAQRQ